jgi:hypothetical protein
MNSLFASNGRNAKNRFAGSSDITVGLVGRGPNSYLDTTRNLPINRVAALTFNPQLPASVYFNQLGAILQNSPPQTILVSNPQLSAYYHSINSAVPIDENVYAFAGTNLSSSLVTSLSVGAYAMIPSLYPIFFDGISYQTIGTGASATLRIGTNPVQNINQGGTFGIGIRNIRFITGGSPGIFKVEEGGEGGIEEEGGASAIPL